MTRIDRLYIVTATLLLAHQIDSAYWHEWKLFGIPGGIQVFVLLNVVLILPFLVGLAKVAKGTRGGSAFAIVLSAVGVATFFIHAAFALRGHLEFAAPVSWAILSATLLSSLVLAWRTISKWGRGLRP
jgi:hypothetical protein